MPAATNTATMVQCFLMNPFHSEPSIPTVTALGLRSPFWNSYKENRTVYLKGKRVDRTYCEYLSGIKALTHLKCLDGYRGSSYTASSNAETTTPKSRTDIS